MYNKSRVYPQSKPIEYSAGFGKEQLPRTPWLGEPEVVEDPFARQRREREAKMREKYPNLEHMPYVIPDPEANQRYADYTKRRGGKDPMGFAEEEMRLRGQKAPATSIAVQQNNWRNEDHFLPKKEVNPMLNNPSYNPFVTKPPSDEWNSVNRPGYDPKNERTPRPGTNDSDPALAKDGRKFGTAMERDAYERWTSGAYGDAERGVYAGSDKIFQDRRENGKDRYNAYPTGYKDAGDSGSHGQAAKKAPPPPPPPKWLDNPGYDPTEDPRWQRTPESNQRPPRPGDASGRMPSYPGNSLNPTDGKIYNGDIQVNRPSVPIDRSQPTNWLEKPQPQSDPTVRYRQEPVRETSDFNADFQSTDRTNYEEEMMGPEGSADNYYAHQQAMEKAKTPQEYQKHYQKLQKMKKPNGNDLRDASKRYKSMENGNYDYDLTDSRKSNFRPRVY